MIRKYLSVYTDTVCHSYTKPGMTYTKPDSTATTYAEEMS